MDIAAELIKQVGRGRGGPWREMDRDRRLPALIAAGIRIPEQSPRLLVAKPRDDALEIVPDRHTLQSNPERRSLVSCGTPEGLEQSNVASPEAGRVVGNEGPTAPPACAGQH